MLSRKEEWRDPHSLKPHPQNVRTHSRQQLRRLARSIRQFGFTAPVLTDENGVILAGHARVLAAIAEGKTQIPVVVIGGLSETQKRAYVLWDNKSTEMAGYDRAALADELQDLSTLLAKDGLDLSLTGFDPGEIDALIANVSDLNGEQDDKIPPIEDEAVSRNGDLWLLGKRHRLLCADSRKADYPLLMESSARAAMLFTDPPYNVDIPKTLGRGRTKHGNFAMASGEMPPAEFTSFLIEVLAPAAEHSTDGALHYVCMDWRHFREILDAGSQVYDALLNVVVWTKTNGGQGSFYRSQHEEIFVFKAGAGAHLNNVQLGRHGRNRSNVWNYPGCNAFGTRRVADLEAHPTVKPVALVADAMRDCTRRGDVVLDPFMGAGSTILAAERVDRRAYGIEIDPLYVDVAIRRWQAATKTDAVLAATRMTFDELAAGASRRRSR